MSLVRGTALSNYPDLVTELGADPASLLREAGIRAQDIGLYARLRPAAGRDYGGGVGRRSHWRSGFRPAARSATGHRNSRSGGCGGPYGGQRGRRVGNFRELHGCLQSGSLGSRRAAERATRSVVFRIPHSAGAIAPAQPEHRAFPGGDAQGASAAARRAVLPDLDAPDPYACHPGR